MRAPDATTPAIAGAGLVCALGFGVASTLDRLLAGRSAVRETGDAAPWDGRGLAALVEPPYLRVALPRSLEPQVKLLNGAGQIAVEAAEEAWRDGGWGVAEVAPDRKGLWLAQVDSWDWACRELRPGFADATANFAQPFEPANLNRSASRYVKPFLLLESLKNNAFSFLANLHDLQGSNTSVAGMCGPSVVLLDFAARALARGDLDRALVVGAGRPAHAVARHDLARQGLRRPGDDPAVRPFDAHGLGAAPGEAAAALALERLGDLAGRGAPVRGLLRACAASSDAPLDALPFPRAATFARAVATCLAQVRAGPEDLAVVVAPGMGLPAADGIVLEGIAAAGIASTTPVVSWQGALGRLALADGLAEVVLALAALGLGRMPGTVGLRSPLPSPQALPVLPFAPAAGAALVLTAGLQGEVGAVLLEGPRGAASRA